MSCHNWLSDFILDGVVANCTTWKKNYLLMPQTCLHALCQHAHMGDLLRVDDFVAIDEG